MLGFAVTDTGDTVDREKVPKCLFTHAQLPAYVDPNQVPSRRRPFSTFASTTCSSALSIALPLKVYESIKNKLSPYTTLRYSRVVMTPSDLLETDFLTECIKKGNILMRSQGRCYEDNFFLLSGGVLRIELDGSTYEKCGLEGKAIEDKGRIHIKTRYAIELDLRSPSMLHGKKAFKRVEWAFENVLNQRLNWRYIDIGSLLSKSTSPLVALEKGRQENQTPPSSPLQKHNPITVLGEPTVTLIAGCTIPTISHMQQRSQHITYPSEPDADANLFEWAGLVLSCAERLRNDDVVNTFYSTYQVPSLLSPLASSSDSPPSVMDVIVLSWKGLIPTEFLTPIWLAIHARPRAKLEKHQQQRAENGGDGTATIDEYDWSILSASGFDNQGYTVMEAGKKDVLSWECWD